MIPLARQRHPDAIFYTEDICTWQSPRQYDLISAWDSTFHLPFVEQGPVLKKMCEGLSPRAYSCLPAEEPRLPKKSPAGLTGKHLATARLGERVFVAFDRILLYLQTPRV